MSKIIVFALLGFFLGLALECLGKHIGHGIAQIKITIVNGGAK